jgi:hypothetical protein
MPRPNGPEHPGERLDPIDPTTFDDKPIPERQWLVRDWIQCDA